MREILFRGKRVSDGKWEYGFHVMYSRSIAHPYSYTDGDHYIQTVPHNMKFKVDPETVCQYTGLTDKNGKKIFEGDIVDYEDEAPGQYEYHDSLIINRGVIEYSEGYFYWTNVVNANLLDSVYKGVADCEVIGNIFDNPELLGNGGDLE